jgi:hypothetical protein
MEGGGVPVEVVSQSEPKEDKGWDIGELMELVERKRSNYYASFDSGAGTRVNTCGVSSEIMAYGARVVGWQGHCFDVGRILEACYGSQMNAVGKSVSHEFAIVGHRRQWYLSDITLEQFVDPEYGAFVPSDDLFGQQVTLGQDTVQQHEILGRLYTHGFVPLTVENLLDYVNLFTKQPFSADQLVSVMPGVNEELLGLSIGAPDLYALFSDVSSQDIGLPMIPDSMSDFDATLAQVVGNAA